MDVCDKAKSLYGVQSAIYIYIEREREREREREKTISKILKKEFY